MSKMQTPKTLRAEDFKSEERTLIDKVAYVINPTFEEIYRILTNGVDFDNLNRQIIDVNVLIGVTGLVQNSPQLKTTINGKVKGLNVINAINLNNPSIYPIQAPFVSFTTNGSILTILNVSGLPVSSQFRLTLEIIG